jgi:hypothetical protein
MATTNEIASKSPHLEFGFQAASTRCTAQTNRMALRPSLDIGLGGIWTELYLCDLKSELFKHCNVEMPSGPADAGNRD